MAVETGVATVDNTSSRAPRAHQSPEGLPAMIDGQTYEAAKQHLLSAFNLVAPNGQVQQAVMEMVREMELAKEGQSEVLLAISAALVDGLGYGNWRKPRMATR